MAKRKDCPNVSVGQVWEYKCIDRGRGRIVKQLRNVMRVTGPAGKRTPVRRWRLDINGVRAHISEPVLLREWRLVADVEPKAVA